LDEGVSDPIKDQNLVVFSNDSIPAISRRKALRRSSVRQSDLPRKCLRGGHTDRVKLCDEQPNNDNKSSDEGHCHREDKNLQPSQSAGVNTRCRSVTHEAGQSYLAS